MSSRTLVTIVLCALAVWSARARPGRPRLGRAALARMPLTDAVNKTLCPITIDINEDENRTPRYIKLVKCNVDAIDQCPSGQPAEKCCKAIGSTWRECYQLEEEVPVQINGELTTFKAQVGCACVTSEVASAVEIS